MKRTILIVIFFITGNILYSQDYYFNQKDEFIQYTNSDGVFTTKLIKSTQGNYRMKFEIGYSNGVKTPLFTEYENGIDKGWYGLVEKDVSQELKGKIYDVCRYYSTEINSGVTVLFSMDKTNLVIFKNQKIIEYKK